MLRVSRARVGVLAEADSEGHASDAGRSLNSRVTCRRVDSGSSGAPSVRHAFEGSAGFGIRRTCRFTHRGCGDGNFDSVV